MLHSQVQVDWLLQARPARPLTVWIKVDTGMHRLGFAPEKLQSVYRRLHGSTNIGQIVLMSHFARADEVDAAATEQQLTLFHRSVGGIEAPVSLANSAAVMAWPASHGDWVRPGIMLYGVSPFPERTGASLGLIAGSSYTMFPAYVGFGILCIGRGLWIYQARWKHHHRNEMKILRSTQIIDRSRMDEPDRG